MTIKRLIETNQIPSPFKPKTESGEIKWILIHGGRFDSDNVACVAMVKEFVNEDVNIIRVDHDDVQTALHEIPVEELGDIIVCDCGRKYDGEIYFDHHQDQKLGSAASLLWFTCGNPLYEKLSIFFRELGNHDSTYQQYRNIAFSVFTYMSDDDPEENDRNFDVAVSMMRQMIRGLIKQDILLFNKINEMELKATETEKGEIISIPWEYFSFANSYAYSMRIQNQNLRSKMVISYNSHDETYSCQTVNGWYFPKDWIKNPPKGFTPATQNVTKAKRFIAANIECVKKFNVLLERGGIM